MQCRVCSSVETNYLFTYLLACWWSGDSCDSWWLGGVTLTSPVLARRESREQRPGPAKIGVKPRLSDLLKMHFQLDLWSRSIKARWAGLGWVGASDGGWWGHHSSHWAIYQMSSDDDDVRVELRHNNDVGSLQRQGSCWSVTPRCLVWPGRVSRHTSHHRLQTPASAGVMFWISQRNKVWPRCGGGGAAEEHNTKQCHCPAPACHGHLIN